MNSFPEDVSHNINVRNTPALTTGSSVGPKQNTTQQYVADCRLYHLHSLKAWEWCHNAELSHSIKTQQQQDGETACLKD